MTGASAAPAGAGRAVAEPDWRGFAAGFLGTALAAGLSALAFVWWLDPYGLSAGGGRARGPLMDANQRFLYPQIARSGAYDAAVVGTSTARLIDPRALDAAFGARFANLAMNAATPYEQSRVAALFLRHSRARAMLFALDGTWCEPDADTRRHTAQPFPGWLYDEDEALDGLRQFDWRSLGIAGAVLLHRLGFARERIRGDGYAVFTPPEAAYDAARARAHIRSGRTALDAPEAVRPAPQPGTGEAAETAAMPALAWLDGLLAALPPDALKLVAFMPVHALAQAPAGTPAGRREALCKARVAAIGRAHGASVVDFRIPSPVTTDDGNYWDALHYRLPVAGRIVAGLKAAVADGRDDAGGFYRVIAHP